MTVFQEDKNTIPSCVISAFFDSRFVYSKTTIKPSLSGRPKKKKKLVSLSSFVGNYKTQSSRPRSEFHRAQRHERNSDVQPQRLIINNRLI
ncbi:hypothetical protein MTP99_006714 [Tenebrio molitor]|nr:hypothetical protein MTP99_006714 [Tenebrio molitor]